MARFIAILIGLGFVLVSAISFFTGLYTFATTHVEETAEHRYHEHPRHDFHFSFEGPFGRFDRQQLQRGFQVYREVCAGCHALSLVAFRDLRDLGYSEPEVRAIADQWPAQVPSVNPETGEPATRKALPADHFPSPYPNEVAARAANNNALPPDLSLITKARHDGSNYVASLLTGYRDPPADLPRPPQGLHYNPYFANLNLAMPPPLTTDGQVTFADGTPATREQMATDVAAFLTWTAEPRLEVRRSWGMAVVPFLIFATILAWFSYKNIWADEKAAKKKAKAAA